ncbi:MAG TPA: OB-fold nucleic acid binding domain-containing protein [Methanobacterium sp.]|nr:OB-fold nucleic acid binding domain-containing protein [Methanobacterium sp.]
MHDNQIFRIALVTTVFGLAGMIFLSGEIIPQEFKIKEINKNNVGEDLSIEGLITTVENPKNNIYILSVIDGTGKINVVIFGSVADEFSREGINPQNFQNRRAKIIGNVKEYNGNVELMIENTKSIKII